jgi:general stress protein 26
MPSPQPSTSEQLWALIKDTRFPVLTTRRSDGGLLSRPVIMQNRDWQPLDYLWFFAPRDSDQVADLQWDSSVSIIYAHSDNRAYVAVFGSASVIEDTARKRLLWSPEAASWFSGGPEDPGLALVRVRIIQADCWDVRRNAVTELFRLHMPPQSTPLSPEQDSSDATCH